MWKHTKIALKLSFITLLILGLFYPLVITGLAQIFFPRQANGSLIKKEGQIIGSELIGQQFTQPKYFHPRPSAAGNGYDASASGGSNFGPTNKNYIGEIKNSILSITKENSSLVNGEIPIDMLTASASGLDPDISLANAYAQVPRVAEARGMSEESIIRIINSCIIDRQFRIFGEPRVNVLKINLMLDNLNRKVTK
ncbi:MAG: potassium-transporting ATPase subunit KdpC [Actinobacteria bacterium]|nr:potassium-transporting ATPase subunit KdpC [Actinomycetota bacterium]